MIVGIVAARHDSRRFPGKNRYLLDGVPLFWHSVRPLLDASGVDRVYVATDSDEIGEYCKQRDVAVIWRPRYAAEPEAPLLSVLRFAVQSIDESIEIVVAIMADCPGHTAEVVDRALKMMSDGGYREIRSFNGRGEESGLLVLDVDVVLNQPALSSHLGCVLSDVKEIHYREELDV